jgi:hypothetical protein
MGYINNSGYYKQFEIELEHQMERKYIIDGLKMQKKPDNNESLIRFENEFPHIADGFKKIQKEQYELFARKMLSYGLGNIAMGSNLDTKEDVNLSLTAIWIRSMDKMQRLKQLVLLNKQNTLDDEPVEDAYVDLSNYSIIALLVKAGLWKK